jgi:pyruvate ferredoxin oxidoreductase beta subunit
MVYEVEQGKMRLSVPVPKRKPVGEYLAGQGRFKNFTPADVEAVQKSVDESWARLADEKA